MYRIVVVGLLIVVMVVALISMCGCPKAKSVEEYETEKPPGFVPTMPPDSGAAEGTAAPTPEPAPEPAPVPAPEPGPEGQ